MADLPFGPPTRADVQYAWERLIAGVASREETALWARARTRAHYGEVPEMLVMSAIQILDGFDLSCGNERKVIGRVYPLGERNYYHSDTHIEEEFQRWLDQLTVFDADPVGFMDDIARHRRPERRTAGS